MMRESVKTPCVLIVDDDANIRKTLSDILKVKGYAAEGVANGEAALAAAEKDKPTVALIDLKLPDMSGLKLMERLKEAAPGIECIVLTGYASQKSAIEAINLGAYSYVQKPYDVEQLLVTIRRAIEKRQADEALRESEEIYRTLVQTAPDAVTVTDLEGKITYVSPRALQIHGFERAEEMLGRSAFELIAPECHEAAMADRHKTLTEGIVQGAEYKMLRRDGSRFFGELSAALVRDAYGQPKAFIGITRDITERKQAQQALHDYAERLEALHSIDRAIIRARSPQEIAQAALRCLRRLAPCLGAAIVTLDHETRRALLLAVDADELAASLAMEGYAEAMQAFEGLGPGGAYLVEHDLDQRWIPPHIRNLRAKGLRAVVGAPLMFKETPLGFLALGLEDERALNEGHAAIIQEMSDQLAVAIQNARLLELERRRSLELEALRQASLHLTSTLEQQPVLEAIVEHALKLVAADNVHIFLYDGEQLTFGAAVWAGGLQREPYAVPRPNGLTYTVARSGERVVIPDVDRDQLFHDRQWGGAVVGLPLIAGGKVLGVMNIAFEKPHAFSESELNILGLLADQAAVAVQNARLHQQVRRHAEELAAALERQKELDRLKDEFIQNVSHELRSPLALIRGYAEMLVDGELGELQADLRKPVSTIARRSQMLSELVEDITLILEAKTRPLEKEPVLLDRVVKEAVEDFYVAAEEAGLDLRVECAPDLPPVLGSLIYLRRVIDNLVGNAIKFTPPGGSIAVRVWQTGDWVALEVKDTGIGIPSDQLGRIFERFYQVDGSARRRYGGVGLGLALVKEITDLHGGQVAVESQVGVGSTFTVMFPVHKG